MKRKTFLKLAALSPLLLASCRQQKDSFQEDLSQENISGNSAVDEDVDNTIDKNYSPTQPAAFPVYIERYEKGSDTPVQESSYEYDADGCILSYQPVIGIRDAESFLVQCDWPNEFSQILYADGWKDETTYQIENGILESAFCVSTEASSEHEHYTSWNQDHPYMLHEYEYMNGRLIRESVYSTDSERNILGTGPYLVRESDERGRPSRTMVDGEISEEWSYSPDGLSPSYVEINLYSLGPYGKTEIAGIEVKADEEGVLTLKLDTEVDAYGNITKMYLDGNLARSVEWQLFEEASSIGVASSFYTVFTGLRP